MVAMAKISPLSASPPTAASQFSHLGYQTSLEKARRAIAINEATKYQEQKERQKEEQARQRRLQAEQLMVARQREEEAKRTGEDLGARLLSALKEEVSARMEAQHRDDARTQAEKDRHSWHEDFIALEKGKITDQLRKDLEPMVRAQLTIDILGEVRRDLETELTPEVSRALRTELAGRLEDQIRKQLRDELKESIIFQLRQENLEAVVALIRDENRVKVLNDLRAELLPRLEQEIRHEDSKGPAENMIPSPENSSVHAEARGEDPGLPPLTRSSDHEVESGDINGVSSANHSFYPDIEEKADQAEVGFANTINKVFKEGDVSFTEIAIGNGEDATRLNEYSHGIGPANGVMSRTDELEKVSATEDLDAGSMIEAQTAPEPKDYRFNPEIHPLRFSSPVDSNLGRKRSLSVSEDGEEDDVNPSKRFREAQFSAEEHKDQEEAGDGGDESATGTSGNEDNEGLGARSAEDGISQDLGDISSDEASYLEDEEEEEEEEASEEEDDYINYQLQQQQVQNSNDLEGDESLDYESDRVDENEFESDDGEGAASRPLMGFSNTEDTAIQLDD